MSISVPRPAPDVAAPPRQRASSSLDLRARIGIVSFDFYPSYGGQGRHTYELWRHLAELGIDVRVLSPGANRLPGHYRGGQALAAAGRSVGFSLYAALALKRWRRRAGIDLLHLNGGPGGVLLLSQPDCRTVYTAHHTYTQQSRMVQGQGWKRAFALAEGRAYRNADAVTADSLSTALSVCNELGVTSDKVTVVPSGFDPSVFRPVEVRQLEDAVLYVGRLDERKGFDFLLRSWVRIAAARPAARLYVVGSGPQRQQAESYLERQGVRDSVAFLPRQPDQELVNWYNRASVVAVPSRFEGFGLSALEAMACGTPVVATNTEGLRDLVIDGVDGALAPWGDADAFAAKVVDQLRRPRRISRRRLREISANYAWPNVATRYVEVYRAVLAS